MTPVQTVTQVSEAIQTAKAGAAVFCTNFFPVPTKLQGWIDHGELLADAVEGAVFLLRQDRDFWHFYFAAADLGALQRGMATLRFLNSERIVVDLVGQETMLAGVLAVFESATFRPYARLVRLVRLSSSPAAATPQIQGPEVILATETDLQAIMSLLEASFDRYADQVPARYEIATAIQNRQVLAIRQGEALAALLFFETQGLTSTIRYWVVAETFRSQRYGSALIRHYFCSQSAVRRFILWVTADNNDAVRKYSHYGYEPDGLIDHVFVNALVHP